MGKKNKSGNSKRQQREESDEEMYDEVEKFHKEDKKIGKGKIKKRQQKEVEEVLNVEGDTSEEEDDHNDLASDFGSDDGRKEPEEESLLPSKNKWGKKRGAFYDAGYVDNDYGGVGDSDEEELAQLEEADALSRQQQLDTAAAAALLDDWADDDALQGVSSDGHKARKKELVVEKKWKWSVVREENAELDDALHSLNTRGNLFEIIVKPLRPLVDVLPKKSALRKQLLLVVDVYTSYLLNLTLFVKLKADSFQARKVKDASVDDHPVVAELRRLKKLIGRVDEYLEENGDALNTLRERMEKGDDVLPLLATEQLQTTKKSKKSKKDVKGDEEKASLEGVEEDDGKRGIPFAIEKNKGLQYKKKKGPSHSRTVKRKQYKKALVRRRSQVPDVRREDSRYSGEARGIRASTIKSTKLVA